MVVMLEGKKLRGGLKKWFSANNYEKVRKNTKTIAAVFPRGSKKKKSNNDDKHGHGQEKRRPSTLC